MHLIRSVRGGGIRSRADFIERILEEVLAPNFSEFQPTDPNLTQELEVDIKLIYDVAVLITGHPMHPIFVFAE
jgi:hypothetical protein